jgi:phage-related protein
VNTLGAQASCLHRALFLKLPPICHRSRVITKPAERNLDFVRKFVNNEEAPVSEVTVIFYREKDGKVPLLDWFDALTPKALAKCRAKIDRLSKMGHELRRPESDYLRDGIYELWVGLAGINYRMLYFFYGRTAVVITHGILKERMVPLKNIEAAIGRKKQFEEKPVGYTYREA